MADGTKPPKGWLIAGLVFLLLALAGCGGGAFGCKSFVDDIQHLVDQGGRTRDGDKATFTAESTVGAILATRTDTICEGTDDSGNKMTLNTPGSNTEGTFKTNDVTFELRYVFDTRAGRTYTVTCTSSTGDGEFIVVPFPGFTNLFVGLGGVAGGVLSFVVGVICLIVGLVKRSGWRKRNAGVGGAAPGGAPPPPGGFPEWSQPAAAGVPPAAPPQPGGYPPAAPPQPGGYPPATPPATPPAPPAGGNGPEDTVMRPPGGWPPVQPPS